MVKTLIVLLCLLALLSSCSPAASVPVVAETDMLAATSTATSTPSRTPRPLPTRTPIVEEDTPTPAPMYVLACVNVPTGGYYINLTSRRTLHMNQLNFTLLETTGSFVAGKLPAPALIIDTSGGKLFGHTATEMAACQTAGACTATYESKVLYMQITCTL